MTEVSKGGLALGKHIGSAYIGNPKIKAIIIGGSISRGYADEYSDLEIGIFWDGLPSDTVRKTIIENVGGDLWSFVSYTPDRKKGASEHYGLDNVLIDSKQFKGTAFIDTKHLTSVTMEKLMSDVVDHYDTSSDKQCLLAAIQRAIPLYGEPLIEQWRTKVNSYPDDLAVKIVQENFWFGPWFCPEAYIQRDDVLVLYQHFVWMEQCILKALAALNRIYYFSPEHKWMDRLIEEMRIVPLNLSSRMKQIFRIDPTEGGRQLIALIQETIDLVELHLPKVNTLSMFEAHPEINIAWARKRWKSHPPYSLIRNIGDENT